jgi:hypothetical protein
VGIVVEDSVATLEVFSATVTYALVERREHLYDGHDPLGRQFSDFQKVVADFFYVGQGDEGGGGYLGEGSDSAFSSRRFGRSLGNGDIGTEVWGFRIQCRQVDITLYVHRITRTDFGHKGFLNASDEEMMKFLPSCGRFQVWVHAWERRWHLRSPRFLERQYALSKGMSQLFNSVVG